MVRGHNGRPEKAGDCQRQEYEMDRQAEDARLPGPDISRQKG